MNKVNGKTKIFGVIADPIEHVKAPSIYNNRWINKNQINSAIKFYGKCNYSNYLKRLIK